MAWVKAKLHRHCFLAMPNISALRWQLWKPLFRLSFVAALLALHHVLYAPFASRYWALAIAGAIIALSLLRFLPLRQ